MNHEYQSNREALGFKDSVLRHFSFLLENRRFSCVEANNYAVNFESADTIVRVSHDPQSYEISANVELIGDTEFFASVEEIAMLSGFSEAQHLGNCEAASAKSVDFIVNELAKLLRNYGGSALHGELGVFQRAKSARSEKASAYMQSLQVNSALIGSNEAWQRKDYKAVVDLLTPCQEWLTNAQLKRLEYAQKQLVKDGKQKSVVG